jgi:hypothetical protein
MPSITFCNLNLQLQGVYFKIRKFTSQNLVYQAAVFCVRNAPKVTYERLRFEKFFRGLYPRTPVKKGREDMRMRMERRGGEGRERIEGGGDREREGREVPPRFKLVPPAFLGLILSLNHLRPNIYFTREHGELN